MISHANKEKFMFEMKLIISKLKIILRLHKIILVSEILYKCIIFSIHHDAKLILIIY